MKMRHVRSKTRSLGQILEKTLEATCSLQSSLNLFRIYALVISLMNEKMGLYKMKN